MAESQPQIQFRFTQIENRMKKLRRECKKCLSSECYRCEIHSEKEKLMKEKQEEYRRLGLLQIGNGKLHFSKKGSAYFEEELD